MNDRLLAELRDMFAYREWPRAGEHQCLMCGRFVAETQWLAHMEVAHNFNGEVQA
jgi:hypothetical protein